MRDRIPRLRTVLTFAAAIGAAFALLVSVAILMLTSALHRNTSVMESAVESIRLAEECQINLLLYERTDDAVVRQAIARDLFDKLTLARRYVTTREEGRALGDAEHELSRVLGRGSSEAADRGRIESAYGALSALIRAEVAQARAAQSRAEAADSVANALGLIGAAGVILLAGIFASWVRSRALRPILSLSSVMQRFGKGDHHVRAGIDGPAELREMAERFNEMATAIAVQRNAQIAFIGAVAHELRSPLMALRTSIELLPDDDPQLVERVSRQVIRAERMVGDLLESARIEAGELELKLRPCDARETVREIVGLFSDTPRHAIELMVPSEPVLVSGDPLRLEQVVTNLVSNAIKYSPNGGRIDVAVRRVGYEVIVEVRDRGMGIAPEEQERLFTPFRRATLSKETIPGVGLGLFVVRRIVEAHGGHIEVVSKRGEGSTFRVYLPALRRDHASLHVEQM